MGSQPNGRQEQQQQLNDNEHNSSDTSVEDSKIQFQNNLRKFKAKCDNELEKLLEKCESRRRSNDRKFFGSESASSSSRLTMGELGARNARRLESANNNFNANKDDDENETWIAAYESDHGLLIWALLKPIVNDSPEVEWNGVDIILLGQIRRFYSFHNIHT